MNLEAQKVIIFDTTLRDGGLGLVESLSLPEKVEFAKKLAEVGVNIIEPGYPAISETDFELTQQIAAALTEVTVTALARADLAEVERCWEALKGAERPRLHLYLPASAMFQKHFLKKTPEQALEMTRRGVAHAKNYCQDVQFTAQDATRADPDYLDALLSVALAEGATTIGIADSASVANVEQFSALIQHIKSLPGMTQAKISIHCHNQEGLAVANSLAALQAGAQQVECTINGVGQPKGNANLQDLLADLDHYGLTSSVTAGAVEPLAAVVSQHIPAWDGES